MLSVVGTSTVAISTLGKLPTEAFMRILKSNAFHVHEIAFICKPCLAKGVDDVCIHNRDFLPPWGGANREIINLLMEGNEETYQRENLGVNGRYGSNCYSVASVDRLFSNPRVAITNPVRFVYVAIDPVTGSNCEAERSSDFAVVSMCRPNITILGVELIAVVRTEDFEAKLLAHLMAIRAMPMFTNCTFVVDVEAGTGLAAPDIQTMIRRHFAPVVFMGDFEGKAGTLTSAATKQHMMELTRKHLDSDDVFFLDKFITSHPNVASLMLQLKTQFHAFSAIVTPAKTVRSNPIVTLTGKASGKRDDGCMTMMRAIRMFHVFYEEAKYRHFIV